jgi:hypothetical protein
MASATLIALTERLASARELDPRQIYCCEECTHILRVSGLGRHTVYFELGDERSSDPLMNRACSVCRHGLPGKNSR